MSKYTVSYGLIPPQRANIHESHILPITKIIQSRSIPDLILTCGRDGTVIRHTQKNGEWRRVRMQTNSDWVSDVAELDEGKFVTVSHDFFLCLLTVNAENDDWTSKMLGYHDDYVKCVAVIGKDGLGDWKLATCGLDMKVKIWKVRQDGTSILMHTIDNAQPEETGSLYALISVSSNELLFDLVAGDNNGNLVLISSKTGEKVGQVKAAHKTNIKLLHLMGTRLLSTSSDGMISLWDLENLGIDGGADALIHSWKWASPVWCIQGTSLEQFLLGDSRGAITRVSLTEGAWEVPELTAVLRSDPESRGVLTMLKLDSEDIWYSFCGDSNLHSLDTKTGEVFTLKGGDALLKSSLLTNRRHVITQNTKGVVQKWDIVSCELLDTFDDTTESFDDLVNKNNTKETLAHWCSVSIKTGKLFVKLSPKFLNTEVYGSALEHYKIINDIKIEIDERYNVGRIALNSILNEFIVWATARDELFRKDLGTKKNSVPGSPSQAPTDASLNDLSRPGLKDKRKLSLFTKLSKGRQSPTPASLPCTPLAEGNSPMMAEDSFILPPPATSHLEGHTAKGGKNDTFQTPALEKRSLSTGSLLAQRLRLLSTANNTNSGSNLSDVDDSGTGEEKGPQRSFNTATDTDDEIFKPNFFMHHEAANNDTTEISKNSEDSHPEPSKRQEFMSDLIAEMRNEYVKEVDANASSFKILSRKPPNSKITREDDSPIIEIKGGVLLLVNCWKEGSSGDTVCFSTYVPTPRYDNALLSDKGGNQQVFESLERNLPYWMGKALIQDEKTTKNYPKLTFVLEPWQDPDSAEDSTTTLGSEQSQSAQHQHHHHLPFHRSKHSERDGDRKPKPLPKVAEAYTKLHAPTVVKVKKIINYVVDRFDSKTPEMRSRTPGHEWLELLCKNQLLDNEMALGSVKTLYWKSQGDIVLQYRRKTTVSREA
ncbi:LAFA_0E15280g1_1 [Lachancea sp. 'fantastica']|nr:LAFA_0E15280g1_1 [Lachancea sp. 'fantastica']